MDVRRRMLFKKKQSSSEGGNESPISIDNYLTIEALEDGLTAQLSENAIEYCVDGDGNWKSLAADTNTESINTGQTLSFRGELIPTSSGFFGEKSIGTFAISKNCNLKGNIMSLLFGDNAADNFSLSGYDYAFYNLFKYEGGIINAENLSLPATTLAPYCYSNMFNTCRGLITAPKLPATTLANGCYYSMFYDCRKLTTAPELPATTLAANCYDCMFNECSNLNYIKMLATDISATDCLRLWVKNVSSTGTLVKHPAMESLPTGTSGIPSGWTIQGIITITECKSLTIHADDVSGIRTNTNIYYTAICTGIDENENIFLNVIRTGTVLSEEFPQNTSTTDTITRTISYTFMGVTATTTITQGVWTDQLCIINLNDQWRTSSKTNPDSSTYDIYESYSNYNINSTAAIMYITISGYSDFSFYIRSYAEGSYDYVMVSQLDQVINNNTSYGNTTLVKAHTRGKQQAGTALSDYTKVEFTNIDGEEHIITVLYRKDGSSHKNDDRGYLLIEKQ